MKSFKYFRIELDEEIDKKYHVYRKDKTLGKEQYGELVSSHDDKEEALHRAKMLNKGLKSSQKSLYGIKYHVKTSKE